MSPALWPGGHAGLPPAVFQICGQDPLRDEALIMERIMREEHKIKTKVYMYPGLPHGFWSVLPTMKASEKFVSESVDGVQWLLEQKKS
jgi:acetyl esterase/lipase